DGETTDHPGTLHRDLPPEKDLTWAAAAVSWATGSDMGPSAGAERGAVGAWWGPSAVISVDLLACLALGRVSGSRGDTSPGGARDGQGFASVRRAARVPRADGGREERRHRTDDRHVDDRVGHDHRHEALRDEQRPQQGAEEREQDT